MYVNLLNSHRNPPREILFLFPSQKVKQYEVEKLAQDHMFLKRTETEAQAFCLESRCFEPIYSEIYGARQGRKEGSRSWITYSPYHLAKLSSYSVFWKSMFDGLDKTLEFCFQRQSRSLRNGLKAGRLEIDTSNFKTLESLRVLASQQVTLTLPRPWNEIIKLLVNMT